MGHENGGQPEDRPTKPTSFRWSITQGFGGALGVFLFCVMLVVIPIVLSAFWRAREAAYEAAGKNARENTSEEVPREATYAAKIWLYDLTAGYYETYLDERLPGVKFKLKNNGRETVERIEVVVYFLDAAGEVIWEEEYTPVSVSSAFSSTPPLKPNYIWETPEGKFLKAEQVPSAWAEGQVKAAITEIRLQGGKDVKLSNRYQVKATTVSTYGLGPLWRDEAYAPTTSTQSEPTYSYAEPEEEPVPAVVLHLQIGLTLEEVNKQAGTDAYRVSSATVRGKEKTRYQWNLQDGRVLDCIFVNGELESWSE